MKPPPFSYVRPATLDEATGEMEADEGAMLLAGGQSLVPMLNLRLARPSTIVDISRLEGMDRIEVGSDRVTIGGLATHSSIEEHDWPHPLTALPAGVSRIGYPAVRHRGTLGGSLAHADPSAELPALMVALNADIELRSARGSREVSADDFFVGYYSTARARDEVVTSVRFRLPTGLQTGFSEFSRRTGDFAIALAAVSTWENGSGPQARVVVGGLDVAPRRIGRLEQALIEGGEAWRDVCAPETLEADTEPADDIHGSAEFRLRVGAEVVSRAIENMSGERR